MMDINHEPGSCASCGVHSCFKNAEKKLADKKLGRMAFMVDQYWPEFDDYIQRTRQAGDLLFSPLDGHRWHKNQYRWTLDGFGDGFGKVYHRNLLTLYRAWRSRRLGQQGAARQQHLLQYDQLFARSIRRQLSYDVGHLVIGQNYLLPFYQQGSLGGRTYDVLMNRFALKILQKNLDQATIKHPGSQTLKDFRVSATMIENEWKLLEQAERIMTPHGYLAGLFPEKTILLPWQLPNILKKPSLSNQIVFLGPTVGRRGAYEMRALLDKIKIPLTVLGKNLEQLDFWKGYPVVEKAWGDTWLENVGLVISPAYIENQPRRLLEAEAAGISIISLPQSGLLQPIQLKGTHLQEKEIYQHFLNVIPNDTVTPVKVR